MSYKRVISLIMSIGLLVGLMSISVYAEGGSLKEVIEGQESSQSTTGSQEAAPTQPQQTQPNVGYDGNKQFLDELQDAGHVDMNNTLPGMDIAKSTISAVTGFAINILSYALTCLLTLRVVLDLVFIAIPFSRSLLSNGFMGNGQAGAGGMPNNSMGGMGGMGGYGGMGSMGGYGGMGGYGSRYGGMNSMGGMGGMGQQTAMNNQGNSLHNIQFVSNAALNAVAAESQLGPDGKPVNAFKAYTKDMFVVLVTVPVLLVLAISGALLDLGFVIGNAVSSALGKLGSMI